MIKHEWQGAFPTIHPSPVAETPAPRTEADLIARLEYLAAKPKYLHTEADTAMTDAAEMIRSLVTDPAALRAALQEPVVWMVNTQGGEYDYNVFTDLRDAKASAKDCGSIVVPLYAAPVAQAQDALDAKQGQPLITRRTAMNEDWVQQPVNAKRYLHLRETLAVDILLLLGIEAGRNPDEELDSAVDVSLSTKLLHTHPVLDTDDGSCEACAAPVAEPVAQAMVMVPRELLESAKQCVQEMRDENKLHGHITDASAKWAIRIEPQIAAALRIEGMELAAKICEPQSKWDDPFTGYQLAVAIRAEIERLRKQGGKMKAPTKKTPQCMCGQPSNLWTVHRADGPCFQYTSMDLAALERIEELKRMDKENDKEFGILRDWNDRTKPGDVDNPEPCCEDWSKCRRPCIPRAEYWKERAELAEHYEPCEDEHCFFAERLVGNPDPHECSYTIPAFLRKGG